MKLLLRVAGAAALLLVAGVIAVVLYVGAAAETAIERSATRALGVPARVGSVRMGLLAETFRMGDLAVANPPGFGDRSFLRLRRGRFELPLAALHRDPVPLRLLHLHGVDLSFERREGRTNYQAVLEHLQRRTASGLEQAAGRRYAVQELVISGITVRVDAAGLAGEGGRLEVQVPELRPAGFAFRTAQGVSLEQLVELVVRAVLSAVAREGVELPGAVARDLDAALGRLAPPRASQYR